MADTVASSRSDPTLSDPTGSDPKGLESTLSASSPTIVLQTGSHDGYSLHDRAYDAWALLLELEHQAAPLGGEELSHLIGRARAVLEQRWGRFQP